MRALQAEILKNKHSNIIWVTFIAFALVPVMGGVFILIAGDAGAMAKTGSLNAKAQAMNFAANWDSYFMILIQGMGVGGIMVFGFVASWIFGREYSDGTAKDLLALPVSRPEIINAKFIVYCLWCLALAAANLVIGFLIGSLLQIGPPGTAFSSHFSIYFITTVLTILLGTPIAFFAIWGKGYMAPLGFVALTLVFAQVVAATGYGYHFPWSVPGLFSGAGGEYKSQLDFASYAILVLTSAVGYFTTIFYWKYSDQVK